MRDISFILLEQTYLGHSEDGPTLPILSDRGSKVPTPASSEQSASWSRLRSGSKDETVVSQDKCHLDHRGTQWTIHFNAVPR